MTPAQSLSKQIIDALYGKGIIDRATDVVRARGVAAEIIEQTNAPQVAKPSSDVAMLSLVALAKGDDRVAELAREALHRILTAPADEPGRKDGAE